jgi:hypothetical protein
MNMANDKVFDRKYHLWERKYFRGLESIFKNHQEAIAELMSEQEMSDFNTISQAKPRKQRVKIDD